MDNSEELEYRRYFNSPEWLVVLTVSESESVFSVESSLSSAKEAREADLEKGDASDE